MPDNRTISFGLWALGLLGTVVCMAVSAAGMKNETYVVFVFTILFILFGFVFAMLNAQEERTAERRLLKKGSSHPLLQKAFDAMDSYEAAVKAGEEESVLQQKLTERDLAAVEAVLSYGEMTVSPKELAMADTARAVEAVKHLQALTELGAASEELEKAQQQAAALCCRALQAIRLLPRRAGENRSEIPS
ncbi:MAG: hypothetical protein PUC59_02780 [Firmicutes bacterium]|nr:hypothetical protein [Bacillota bacterium]